MVEMERMELVVIDYYLVINEVNWLKLYMFMFMNLEVFIGIVNKVKFDIRFYFFFWGMEDVEKIRKMDLRVNMDFKILLKYVMKIIDELMKYYWENDKENYLGVMLELLGM